MDFKKIQGALKTIVREMEKDSVYETEFSCMMNCGDCPLFVYHDSSRYQCLYWLARQAIDNIQHEISDNVVVVGKSMRG